MRIHEGDKHQLIAAQTELESDRWIMDGYGYAWMHYGWKEDIHRDKNMCAVFS